MLPILKLGSTGPLVPQWQTFLRGQGLAVDDNGLGGNQSFGRAALLGFELTDFSPIDSGFPPRQALFGPLQFVPAPTAFNRKAIRINNGWNKANLVMLDIPQLAGIPGARMHFELAVVP